MGFDDLARHMASRDGKKGSSPSSGEEILAQAAIADRRMSRTRDLILGSILFVGGLAILGLYVFYLYGVWHNPPPQDVHQGPNGKSEVTYYYSIGLPVLTAGMIIGGLLQLVRGLRGTSR